MKSFYNKHFRNQTQLSNVNLEDKYPDKSHTNRIFTELIQFELNVSLAVVLVAVVVVGSWILKQR